MVKNQQITISALELQLSEMPGRNFNYSELALLAAANTNGFIWTEDDYAQTQSDDRVEPISENLYRITWNSEDFQKGPYTIHTSLRQALIEVGAIPRD